MTHTTRPIGGHVSSHTAQGSRDAQQDRLVVQPLPEGYLFAIFDGHGGDETAALAVRELTPAFDVASRRYSDPLDILRETVAGLVGATHDHESGSTVSILWLQEETQAHGACLGDSPIVILDAQGKIQISPTHNVRDNLPEREAAIARGGQYGGGYLMDPRVGSLGLQMSRALGDRLLGRVLSREPELFSISVNAASCVIVGSDGLLDPLGRAQDKQLTRLIGLVGQGHDAAMLVEDALVRQTRDNVSAIVWRGRSARPL
jgi:serine/threonine protein phosphatase PrpC